MVSLLLILIYIAFISLGLPDSLLGSAWPVMYRDLAVPLSSAGIITMIVSGATIVSSLLSDRLTRKFGAGFVTAASVMMTAVALFGFSSSRSLVLLCLWAVPYGLGAGAVDAALNNYVALHYASRHMSWLHCFWGVGASISPYIMSWFLLRDAPWSNGYRAVGVVQMVLAAMLFLSLPLWKKRAVLRGDNRARTPALTLRQALNIKGVKLMLMTFFCYCALETTTGMWAASYLVRHRGIGAETAARYASLFFLGITAGRFLSGFLAEKVGDRRLIRGGIAVLSGGIFMVAFAGTNHAAALTGLVIIGLGCAPVYPAIIHATPSNFGRENSQAVIGIQMAGAYVGSTFMPPVFGLLAEAVTIGLYPLYLMLFAVLMLVFSERVNAAVKKNAETPIAPRPQKEA